MPSKPARSIASGSAIATPCPRPASRASSRLVPGHHLGAARDQRLDRRQARAGEAEHGIALAGKGGAGDHLSFSVDRPASASTKAMIQKRITTVGSDQPICSKWWWIGAILKTRLPVRL